MRIVKQPLTMEEMKKIAFNMLCWFDDICREYNLKYSLDYGTLLGAIRHKGFIPWDDDIDICMPRDDYDRFSQLMVEHPDERYHFYTPETDAKYLFTFGKVVDTHTIGRELSKNVGVEMGVCIDIFPFDTETPDENIRQKRYKQFVKYRSIIDFVRSKEHKGTGLRGIISKIADMCFSIYGKKRFINKVVKFGKRYNNSNSNWINRMVCFYNPKRAMPKDLFENLITAPFEGREFSIVSNWDYFLTNIYGDYMKLPPEEERIPHHELVAYWKDGFDE